MLGYEYLLRSGEVPTLPANAVIDVRQAAVALACARPTPAEAVTAKREVSRLFADRKTYTVLFNQSTDPLRLARAVAVVQRVDNVLDRIAQVSDGVRAGVAIHGRRVIAHLVLRDAGNRLLSDPAAQFDDFADQIEGNVERLVAALVAAFPASSYPGNLFKNLTRTNAVLKTAGL